jgi:hypothetical protein
MAAFQFYQLDIGRPPYATQCFLVLYFIVHFSLHVSALFGGHLQVVHKHKNIQGSHHIFNGSVE